MTFLQQGCFPQELLREVVDSLDRKSLCSFSRTCVFFHDIANRALFRDIKLGIVRYQPKTADTSSWSDILSRRSAWKHVRRLRIVARDSSEDESLEADSDEDEKGWPESEEQWQTLATFFQRLPHLRDLEWALHEVFPGDLLAILTEATKDCRIHIQQMQLSYTRSQPLSESELDLVTSPLLHSVGFAQDGPDNKLRDAFLTVVRSGAHDLQHVEYRYHHSRMYSRGLMLQRIHGRRATTTVRHDGRRLEEIAKRCVPQADERTMGALTSLVIRDPHQLTATLEAIQLATDFSVLKDLKLEGEINLESLDFLANQCRFTRLQTLALGTTLHRGHNAIISHEDHVRAQSLLEVLFASLPALQNLHLVRFYKSTFYQILSSNGPQLKTLKLDLCSSPDGYDEWLTSPEALEALCSRCTNLKKLSLPLHRTCGNAREVSFYQALGMCRKLVDIELVIDCNIRDRVYGTPGGGFGALRTPDVETPLFPEALRAILINSAFDSRLARAILETIANSRRAEDPPLRQLTLICEREMPQFCVTRELKALLEHMRQSWICTRNLTGDYSIDRTEENPRKNMTVYILGPPQSLSDPLGSVGDQARAVIQELWPGWSEEDWTQRWHSQPLAEASI